MSNFQEELRNDYGFENVVIIAVGQTNISNFNSNLNYHINAVGRRGSLLIWHGGVWHANGANNTKKSKRIGLNASYSPSWWNLRREQGHQPIFNEIYVKLPKKLKNITKHKIGSNRAQCYE